MKPKRNLLKTTFQFATLSVFLAGPVFAQVISDTVSLGPAEVFASGTLAGDSDQLISGTLPTMEFVFDQFDPALGALNSVTIETLINFRQTFTSSSLVTPDPDDDFHATGFKGFGYIAELNGNSFSGGGQGNGFESNTPGEEVALTLTLSDTLPLGSHVFSDLEGSGTVTFSMVSTALSEWRFHGYFTDHLLQRDAGASATITYNYTPVPEPTALTLIAVGGGLAWLLMRRRRVGAI